MSRRLNLSVLGSYSANEAEHQLADELGEGLASMKLNVVSGGQEGGQVINTIISRIASRSALHVQPCTFVRDRLMTQRSFDPLSIRRFLTRLHLPKSAWNSRGLISRPFWVNEVHNVEELAKYRKTG